MHCTDQFEASTLFLSPRQGAGLPENFSVVHVRRVGILNLTWIGWEINLNRNCYVFSTRIHVVIVIVFRGKEFIFAALGWLRGAEIRMGICQGGGGERCWSSVWIKVQLIKTATFCCPVNAVTTLLTVVKSPGENSNTISSNVIEMSWPPSVEAGVKYLNDNEQGFKTWKKQFPFKNRLYGWMLKKSWVRLCSLLNKGYSVDTKSHLCGQKATSIAHTRCIPLSIDLSSLRIFQ